MAENKASLRVRTVTRRYLDMAGTVIYSAPEILPASVLPPEVIPRLKGRINLNSSSGNTIGGAFDDGQTEEGKDTTVIHPWVDPNNAAEITIYQFLVGMHENDLTSRTGFGAFDVASTLTLKGPKTCKIEDTIRDSLGGANIVTYTAMMKSLEAGNQDGTAILTATWNIVSTSLTWS